MMEQRKGETIDPEKVVHEMKNKKKLILIIAIIVLAALAALAAVFLLSRDSQDAGNGVTGEITDNWDSGIDHGSVESSGIQIPGFKEAEMKEGDDTLHLNIGNPQENNAGFLVTVKLEDGTVLYESPVLEPGQGISELPLLTSPKKGTYTAYAEYQVVTLDEEHTPMNTARTIFTLNVK